VSSSSFLAGVTPTELFLDMQQNSGLDVLAVSPEKIYLQFFQLKWIALLFHFFI